MRTIDITFDLETTSLQSTAAIMTFGAVAWNREAKSNPFLLNDNMAVGCNDGFGRYIILAPHLSQQFVSGFDFDRDTARWWNSQSDDAKDAIDMAEPVRCERLVTEFSHWLRSVLDVAGVVICVRRANTHGLDFFNAAHLVDDNLKSIDGCIDIFLTCLITLGFDGSSGLDVATAVNDTENGVCSSQIQANHVGLD